MSASSTGSIGRAGGHGQLEGYLVGLVAPPSQDQERWGQGAWVQQETQQAHRISRAVLVLPLALDWSSLSLYPPAASPRRGLLAMESRWQVQPHVLP